MTLGEPNRVFLRQRRRELREWGREGEDGEGFGVVTAVLLGCVICGVLGAAPSR
jgi:hypothetical protein